MVAFGFLIASFCIVFGGFLFANFYTEEEGRGFGSFGGLFLCIFGFVFGGFCRTLNTNVLLTSIICGGISAICLLIKKLKK